jgi:large subunit ribosomal protein L40e
MIIYVKILTNKSTRFEVDPSDTIQNLKDKILDMEVWRTFSQTYSQPDSYLRLISSGRQRDDGNMTLSECNITENAGLHAIGRSLPCPAAKNILKD